MALFRRRKKIEVLPATQAALRRPDRMAAQVRGYLAAIPGRLHGGVKLSRMSADREVRDALENVRAWSREAERNVGLYRRMLGIHDATVIGQGIHLRPMTKNADGRPDLRAAELISSKWRLYTTGRVTLDGQMNMQNLSKLLVRSWMRDGEVFIRLHRDRKRGLLLEPLEADHCPVWLDHYEGRTLFNQEIDHTYCGISYDKDGRPIAYHLARQHPGRNTYGNTRIPDTEAVDARDIIHLKRDERIGQVRGVPMGVSTLADLDTLAGYVQAELVAARMGAERPGVLTQDVTAEEQFEGDEIDEETDEAIFDLRPAGVTKLPPGYKLEFQTRAQPSGSFDPFVTYITRQLAASWGVSHSLLTRDLRAANFSSLKIESIDVNNYFQDLRDLFEDVVLRSIYAAWLDLALLRGTLIDQGISLRPALADKYREVDFIYPPFPTYDLEKDLSSEMTMVRAGIKELDTVCLQYRGRSLYEVAPKRAQEREFLHSLGLVDPTDEAASKAAGPGRPPKDPEPEPEPEPAKPAPTDKPAPAKMEPEAAPEDGENQRVDETEDNR